MARPVRVRQWVTGGVLLVAGIAVAAGALPGAATGPRIGIAAALIMLGALVVGIPLTTWILRRTTRPEDYAGTCPVGRSCTCGAFNMNPRTTCRACGAELGPLPADEAAAAKEPI